MGTQIRFSWEGEAGTWGRAAVCPPNTTVAVEGQATDTTTIGSWRVVCHFAEAGDPLRPSAPGQTVTVGENTSSATPSVEIEAGEGFGFLIELRTWPNAGYNGTMTREFRELRISSANLELGLPCPVVDQDLVVLLREQAAGGGGRWDNVGGEAWGWAPSYQEIAQNVEALWERIAAATDLSPTIEFSTTITPTSSGRMTYDGADDDVALVAGTPPYLPGAVVEVVFEAGSVTAPNAVTLGSGLDDQLDLPVFDESSNMVFRFWAATTTRIVTTCTRESATDSTPPTIESAEIGTDGETLIIHMSEASTCTGVTGLSLSGTSETITALDSGNYTADLTFSLSGLVIGGTLTLDVAGTNDITDNDGNPLGADADIPVTSITYPTISSMEIDGDALTVVFSRAVTSSNTTNWELDVGGTPATITHASGTGTTHVYTSSVAAEYGDTVTATATAPTGHAATVGGLALQAFEDAAVDNVTAGTTLPWVDPFTSDLTWIPWSGSPTPSYTIQSGYLSWTASSYYAILYHMAGGALPADMYLTVTIPHSLLGGGNWGCAVRYNDANQTGIRLWFSNGTSLTVGTTADLGTNVTVTVTGGFPASWSVNQEHTIGIRMVGTAGQVMLDGSEYGTFTSSINNGSGYGIALLAGYGGTFMGVSVDDS